MAYLMGSFYIFEFYCLVVIFSKYVEIWIYVDIYNW
jgi:hypothetical protein